MKKGNLFRQFCLDDRFFEFLGRWFNFFKCASCFFYGIERCLFMAKIAETVTPISLTLDKF